MGTVGARGTMRGSSPRDALRRFTCSRELPAELIIHILRYLPIAGLRQAAAVSRTFHACARNAGLYIEQFVRWGSSKGCEEDLAKFKQVVQHALTTDLQLCVMFWWVPRGDLDDATRHFPPLAEMLMVIASAHHVLVKLSLRTRNSDPFQIILSQPMPRLREFEFVDLAAHRPGPFSLPLDIFAGQAPLLRRLHLGNVILGPTRLPAFSNVTLHRMSFWGVFPDSALPEFSFASHFPKLTSLTLEDHRDNSEVLQNIDLCGLLLRSLVLIDYIDLETIRRSISLDDIPVVRRRRFDEITWLEPESNETDYSLRLLYDSSSLARMTVVIDPSHHRWRRVYDFDPEPDSPAIPVLDKPGGIEHLTSLSLEVTFLSQFLSCDTTFPALRRIEVDIFSKVAQSGIASPGMRYSCIEGSFFNEDCPAPDFDSYGFLVYNVPCTALEQLSLVALDAPVTLWTRELAFLGCALGQLARPHHEKAALTLVGVDLGGPEVGAYLDSTFPTVERRAFSMWSPADYYEHGFGADAGYAAHPPLWSSG